MGGLDGAAYAALSACGIAGLVGAREVSAREVVDAALERAEAVDGWLRAFREVWPESARRAAEGVDAAVAAGERLPLAGVPIGVKAWGWETSSQVRRLVAAGCVPVGATAVPDGSTPWQTWGHTDRGPTRNPWCPRRSPGGSSAGSAAAVAAGIVPLATGVDGAGSTRIPAAWCGVLGVKPTAGRVPGADASGLAVGGPLARGVDDAARYLDVVGDGFDLAAHARRGSGGEPVGAVWSADLGALSGGWGGTDPEVAEVARAAVGRLARAGALDLREVPVRLLDPAPAWHAARAGGGDARAQARRAANDARLRAVFDRVDVLLTPTTPNPPHGHDGPGDRMSVALTWAFNVSGHPALSLPAGLDATGCPVGLQAVADRRREDVLLRVAAAWEALAAWPSPPSAGA